MNIPPFYSPAAQLFSPAAKPSLVETPIENKGSVFKPITEAQEIPSLSSSYESPSALSSNSFEASSDSKRVSSEGNQKQDQQEQEQKQPQRNELKLQEAQQELIEQQQIQQLSARDREVRNHERAHAAIGGQYAGAPKYQFERGPDGINYAVGGEVSISTGAVSGDPEATIEKAQIIRRAALAPAEPSSQDRKVAAEAAQMEAQARVELANLLREEREQRVEVKEQGQSDKFQDSPQEKPVFQSGSVSFDESSNVRDMEPESSSRSPTPELLNQQSSLLNIITGSNANGKYLEPGQFINRIV